MAAKSFLRGLRARTCMYLCRPVQRDERQDVKREDAARLLGQGGSAYDEPMGSIGVGAGASPRIVCIPVRRRLRGIAVRSSPSDERIGMHGGQ